MGSPGEKAAALFSVAGMTCSACAASVEKAVNRLPGIVHVAVDVVGGRAQVTFSLDLVNDQTILQSIEDAGFEPQLIKTTLNHKPELHLKVEPILSCHSAKTIQQTLQSVPGVDQVNIDLPMQKVSLSYDPGLTGPRRIVQAVERIESAESLKVVLFPDSEGGGVYRGDQIKHHHRAFVWSLIFTVPVFLSSMVFMAIPYFRRGLDTRVVNMLTVGGVLRCVLCSPVQFVIGWRFYKGCYRAIRNGSANMDVLIALGTNAAYFYSVYSVVRSAFSPALMATDLFETSAMLITFVLLGKYLEVVAKGKTSEAVAKLMELAPERAMVVSLDEENRVREEEEVDTRLVERNDVIRVVPGARVACDGEVIWGKSYVNESMITGEARQVCKRKGDMVIGGTVNENGVLYVRVTRVGSERALSQIVSLIEAAQMAKAPVQKLADRVSKYFVPMVIAFSLLTWLTWFLAGKFKLYPRSWIPSSMDEFELALQFGISVMVIACPCALGLATPTAVMVGTGVGASQGVLIKSGQALETTHKVNCIVFDKTGTLTLGKPLVVTTQLLKPTAPSKFYALVGAAEANSEHPLAKAIVEHAKKLREDQESVSYPEAQHFESIAGHGVKATVLGSEILVGNKSLMLRHGVMIPAEAQKLLDEAQGMARTGVVVSIEKEVVGVIGVSDPLKASAGSVLSILKGMGIRCIMVTGDNVGTARAIAKEAGIQTVIAQAKPQDKAAIVKELQAKGYIVAMVGDGVNDSPALAAADVGMAIGAGTDIAVEAADIVLVKSNLEDIVTAIHLSKKTFARIRLNYFWALGYNLLGVPVAAGALFPIAGIRLPPWLAGASMAASSVSVVCSSLMLRHYKRPRGLDAVEFEGVRIE